MIINSAEHLKFSISFAIGTFIMIVRACLLDNLSKTETIAIILVAIFCICGSAVAYYNYRKYKRIEENNLI